MPQGPGGLFGMYFNHLQMCSTGRRGAASAPQFQATVHQACCIGGSLGFVKPHAFLPQLNVTGCTFAFWFPLSHSASALHRRQKADTCLPLLGISAAINGELGDCCADVSSVLWSSCSPYKWEFLI